METGTVLSFPGDTILSFSCGLPLHTMEIDLFGVSVPIFDVCCAIRDVFFHYCSTQFISQYNY